MPGTGRVERIRAALVAAFAPEYLRVDDQSERHRGHAGAASGRGHFHVEIVAGAFAGQSPLARHRSVHAALGSLMETDIHALSLRVRAPGEPDRA
jgi:BolA family transcriptional regulator, general stress-responsive regulator